MSTQMSWSDLFRCRFRTKKCHDLWDTQGEEQHVVKM